MESPIIRAIDAEHYEHHHLCVACSRNAGKDVYAEGTNTGVAFPCRVMLAARNAQRSYANQLRRDHAINVGQLTKVGA
jgi:uncharacterized protein (DUF302 family)